MDDKDTDRLIKETRKILWPNTEEIKFEHEQSLRIIIQESDFIFKFKDDWDNAVLHIVNAFEDNL